MQAPVGIYLLKGPDYIIEMANEPILQLWGKGEGVIGKPVIESFPEVKEQGFIELLDNVRATGIPFQADEIAVWYNYDGLKKQKYVTLLYQPFYEGGVITGIFSIATDVTERVLARRQLHDSAQNLRNVIRQAPVAMCIFTGPEYIVEMANERMEALWGRQVEEVVGKPIFEGLPEAKNQGFEELLERVYKGGETIQVSEQPVTLPRKEGIQTIYINLVYEPLYEADDSISGVIAIAVDVTEQVINRKKIEASEEHFRVLVTATSNVVYRMSGDWEVMWTLDGKGFLSDTGKPASDWLQKYIHPEDQQRVRAQIQKAISTRSIFEMEHQVLQADGSLGWTFSRAIPVFNEQDEIVEWFGAANDITARKAAEEAYLKAVGETERQKRLLEAVTSSTPDLVYIFDLNYRFAYANAALLEMWGKTWEQSAGRGLLELGYEPWHAEMHEREIDQVVATKLPIRGEVSFPHAFLGKRIYDYIFAPVINEAGQVEAVAGTTRDITEIKRAEEALRQSEVELQQKVAERTEELQRSIEELRRLNQNLEEFAYAASHDLKEPVRKIHFFGDQLMQRLSEKMDDQDFRIFERMQGATKRMGTLIDELLTYSQVTKGISDLESVDLNRKVYLVSEDLELEIQEKQAQIISAPLPTIRGNKRQMQQLFFNLINNALKYSKAGVPPQIHINYRLVNASEVKNHLLAVNGTENYHLIEVKDNGVGFEQKDAERIFQIFTRLHGNSEYRGTGIGLSIVHKVVENHNGCIWAQSSPGAGATFSILLPASE